MWRSAFKGTALLPRFVDAPNLKTHPSARQPVQHLNAIQPFNRTMENSHALWNLSSLLEEIQRHSIRNGSIMHAQHRSCVRGEADADQDPSRVLCVAWPNPGQPSSRELIVTPRCLRDGGKSSVRNVGNGNPSLYRPTGTALCKPTN